MTTATFHPRTWHGLRYDQWERIWVEGGWRDECAQALYDVAVSPHALYADRMTATQALNQGIVEEVLAPIDDFPGLMFSIMADVAAGRFPRKKKKAARMHARLQGAQWMLATAGQIVKVAREDAARAELHADLARSLTDPSVFPKPTPEQDAALDRLFAMMKPHFEAALADAVRRGVLVPRVVP